ncbi:hypothetical protein P5750_06970 [Bacillus cereus]|uniref:hypothetical protein n=2 Tax=Bacillus cereus group TaxID=86661 RepID=UPI0020D1FB39|nr:hypothetical protein [Bacillus cereus]MDF9541537.1 hypothetical protein [Bacillus cereus]MDF9583192.1 hypothetical protein [Bacillus cereus]
MMNLLIEQELKREFVVTALVVLASSVPKAVASSSLPLHITARLKPATEYWFIFSYILLLFKFMVTPFFKDRILFLLYSSKKRKHFVIHQ